MSTIELTATARSYRELQAEIKALEAQADALKQQMIREMDARQADRITAGEYTIRYTAYQAARVDAAKLKAAGLYDQYSTTATALRFSVA